MLVTKGVSMAGPHLYERAHYRHDTHWLLPALETGDTPLCLACVIEMMEDGTVSVVRKKHMLSSFQECLENNSSTVVGLLLNDARMCTHFIQQLLGMLVNTEDNTASVLVTKILVQFIVDLKQEEFVHWILDGCQKELSAVASMRVSLPIFCFMGKLVDAMPDVAEIFVADHYNLVEALPHGLMYPNEALKAAVCYLYGKLYSSPTTTKKLSAHFTDKLCRLFLSTLENAQTKELQINCMGLLKQLLNFDHFVPVIMNASIWLEDSEDTPTLQAQNPLPLLLKKILLSKEEFLQIASAQCISAVLVHSPASYALAFIHADIPEFLFENLLSRSEVLIWSIYCCLLLMTEERLFFTKGHTAYGIEAVLRSLKHVLQLNNKELQKQGLLLLIEILNRQPLEIKLFTNPGIFKAAVGVLEEAVNSSLVEVAIEGTRAASAFLRKDHLSTPVQYGELERLISKMLECCAALPLTSLRRKKPVNRDGIKSVTRYGQRLTNTLEGFHNACKLALDCQSDFTTQNNAFTAPSSKGKDTLEAFTWFLLNTCDNVCIPTVLKYYEHMPVPATMETFFLLLTDIFAVLPNIKETFSVKLASASFIRLSMEVKSTLCSGQRNRNLNNACSVFLTCLCFTLWEMKAGGIKDSQTEVHDILSKSMIHIEGSIEQSLSVLLESPDIHTSEDLRLHQQALIFIACVAYLLEDRFIPETDLFWAVLAFLHSLQSQQYEVSSSVTRASLYLLACCQDKCKAMNMMSVNMVSRLLENISEIRLVYFHHPLFLKFFFCYPQLLEKYGCQILELWIHQEDNSSVSEENPNLMLTVHDSIKPVLSIINSYPNAVLVFLDLISSSSEELADKGLLILKAFLHENHSFDASNLLLNRLLRILQEIVILPDMEVEKKLPLILSLLCLAQQKGQSDSEMDGTYFKLLYHVSNLSGKCNPCRVSILQPAFSFLHCSLHQSSTSCKMRATAMLLSNNSFIELVDKVMEYTWDETKTYPNELFEPLCCSALLITSSLIHFQQLYALQVHKTVHVDVHKIVNVISYKYKSTSSKLMISLLYLFKELLRHQFSSPLLDIILTKESEQTKPDKEGSIKPLTTQNTLYLVAAFQNLLIQKDAFLVQATIDCLETLTEFLYDKAVDLALHIATHPWNRFVFLLWHSCKENFFLQPGVLRFMALLVKYDSMNILTLNEIKQVIEEAAKLKLSDLPSYTVLDLQIFLQQLLNKNLALEPSKRCTVQDLLQKTVDIQNEWDPRSTLFREGIAGILSPSTQ